jgi:hypothetical protein
MKAIGPHSVWPRVYPQCKWPRRNLITVVKPGQPIRIIKHWRGVPSTVTQIPASEGSTSAVGSASESPSECPEAVSAWH